MVEIGQGLQASNRRGREMTDERFAELMRERAELLRKVDAITREIKEAGRIEEAMDWALREPK